MKQQELSVVVSLRLPEKLVKQIGAGGEDQKK